MKRLLFSIVAIIFMTSCYKDLGNYDYTIAENITIDNLNETYTVEALTENLVISPKVMGNKGDEFTYVWEVIKYDDSNMKLDTISTDLNLNIAINLPPDEYKLLFKVKNKKSLYETTKVMDLIVMTQFSRGWYVLKDENGNADLDFFPVQASKVFMPDAMKKQENIIYTMNEKSLKGSGTYIGFNTAYSVKVGDDYQKTASFFISSEQEFFVLPVNDLTIVADCDNISYNNWEKGSLDFVIQGYYNNFLAYNGELYVQDAQGNNGKFGGKKSLDKFDTPYKLSKYTLFHPYGMGGTFWDELSSSFISCNYNGVLGHVIDDPQTELPATNNNHNCLFLGRVFDSEGYGILENKDTRERLVCHFPKLSMAANFVINISSINSSDVAGSALSYAISSDELVLYMIGKDGHIWSRNLSNSLERKEFDIPVDEKACFIQQHKIKVDEENVLNVIAVASQKGEEYVVRFFEKNAGSFVSSEPLYELQGKGEVKDVIFIWDSISSKTTDMRDV